MFNPNCSILIIQINSFLEKMRAALRETKNKKKSLTSQSINQKSHTFSLGSFSTSEELGVESDYRLKLETAQK